MKEYLMKNMLKYAQSPNSNYPFNSRSQRSINLNSSFSNPGPGAYNPPLKDIQTTSKYHVQKEKIPPVEREFLWMLGSERQSAINPTNNNVLIGPGAYQIQRKQKLLQYSWSKASRFKTTPNSEMSHSPGPCDYDYSMKRGSSGAQFVFKSKLKKSLQFPQEQQAKQTPSKQEKLHDPDIEVEHQQSQQKLTKRSEQKSSVFASKVPRFNTQVSTSKIGPGAYEVLSSSRSRQKSQFPKVVKFKPARAPMFREKLQSQIGPGSYNINKHTIGRDLQYKGYPLCRETRFNFSGKNASIPSLPGPGSYMQNKYVYVDPKEWLKQKTSKKLKSYIHQPLRHKLTPKKEAMSAGFYNLNSYDIEFRMRKKMEHANKLKLMQISIPGFNSKVPRLL